MDKEKIIQGLKWCIKADKQCVYALVDCPYVEQCKINGQKDLKQDALDYIENMQTENDEIIKSLKEIIEGQSKREEHLIKIIKELTEENTRLKRKRGLFKIFN